MKKKLIVLILMIVIMITSIPTSIDAAKVDANPSVLYTYDYTYVIKDNGDLWRWSYNDWANVVSGKVNASKKGKKILDNVASIHEGSYHMVALKTNGEVWCWGSNNYGMIGDGTTKDCPKPKKILGGVKTVQASGNNYTVVLKKNGEVWAWGDNSRGQLGNGSYKSEYKPKMIIKGVSKISEGSNHVLVLKKNGELWAWGYNGSGQIGNSSTKDVLKPKKIMSTMKEIYAVHNTSLAISKSGKLYIWGSDYRSVFNGDSVLKPQKIMSDVKNIAFDPSYLYIIKDNNELWSLDQDNDFSPYKVKDDAIYVNGAFIIDSNYDFSAIFKNALNVKVEVEITTDIAYFVYGDFFGGYAVSFNGTLWKISYKDDKFYKTKIMSGLKVYGK